MVQYVFPLGWRFHRQHFVAFLALLCHVALDGRAWPLGKAEQGAQDGWQ